MSIKVLEVRKNSFQRDMLHGAMNTRMEVTKTENGFCAKIMGEDISVERPLQADAIREANKIFRDKFLQGKSEPQKTV